MTPRLAPGADLQGLYESLRAEYGPQNWWPAEGRFEILIGAVLTQNTAWTNVERAIARLQDKGWLEAAAILAADERQFTEALRPSGTFRIKAQRLITLCRWFEQAGGFTALDRCPTTELRNQLLALKGIGPETADAILLYAFDRPVFVIDAYTRRLLARMGWLAGVGKRQPAYESLRSVFELTLATDVNLFAQYHALIVEHAKQRCRARPLCDQCMLRTRCQTGLDA